MDFSLGSDLPIGKSFLLYSEPGVGKTSSLVTLAEHLGKPIKVYYAEKRNPLQPMLASYPELKKTISTIKFSRFDTFDGYLDDANALLKRYEDGERPFAALGFDSLTFSQQLFKSDMEDDRFQDRLSENKRSDLLIDRFRVEMSDWGGLGSMMKRLTKILQTFSCDYGLPLVCMATLSEFIKYSSGDATTGPSFQGKDYADSFTGYFDFIGKVQQSDKDNKPYPPHVFFKSEDGDFVAKSVSRSLNEKQVERGYLPMDFRVLLKLIDKDSEG